jgi:L-aminopeptidase/D-esterase-like protein
MIDGVLVGQYERIGDGWLTGTTVVLCPDGAVAGYDARGGAPGTRETDCLDPRNLVDRVHAVVLSGGSAYGLAAATGVMDWLERRGIGWPAGPTVVPIVPAAVVFDLGRGGNPGSRPTAEFGLAACEVAGSGPIRQGNYGAGAGTTAGGIKGGVGFAATTTPSGFTVEALTVLNAAGSIVDRRTGRLFSDVSGALRTPEHAELDGIPQPAHQPLNTTIGAVWTDAALTKAQCQRLAGSAHDGLAVAVRPAHTMHDGDTVFALSTGHIAVTGPDKLNELIAAAAGTFTAAICNAALAARSTHSFPCYRDVFPSVFA